MAVALCPALIMLLVGSLMWFLVEVFYPGEHKFRLLWVLTMFVVAIVGIARIAIEEGLAYASLFGWALTGAVVLVLVRIVPDGLLIGGPILALVWWAAHKLTWDCTLIDDTQDASGAGLLQQMKLDAGQALGLSDLQPAEGSGVTERPEAQLTKPWWETLLEPDRRPHAPGVWVIYFSLAALPLFGIGGWFVPGADAPRRAYVFGLVVIYVASGLGLLLATSFLGLRRYLRQRKLEMPMEMTTTWIVGGVVLILGTLLVAAILPRPSREYSLSQVPSAAKSLARRASQYAIKRDGTRDDDSQDAATAAAQENQDTQRQDGSSGQPRSSGGNGKDGKGKSPGGKQKGNGKSSSGDSPAGKTASSPGGDKHGDRKGSQGSSRDKTKSTSQDTDASQRRSAESAAQKNQQSAQQQPAEQQPTEEQGEQQPQPDKPQSEQPQSSRSSPGQMLSQAMSLAGLLAALKWLFYAGLLIAGLVFAWIYREELLAAWQKLLAELRELWERWFGKQPATADAAETAASEVRPPRPFNDFADPFLTGEAARMPWPRLVRYSFEALEAWAREQDTPRPSGQTAHEFAQSITLAEPEMGKSVQSLAAWYSQLAYAPHVPARSSPEALRELWHQMAARRTPPLASHAR
jgi:hypothetical protein